MKLALNGGVRAHQFEPPAYPDFSADVFARIAETLGRGPMQGLSKAHPVIRELEQALASFHGVDHCLGTSSGHGALQSALIGLELTGGDEVITSPYSWGASVSCILHNGAVPVFADVDPDTGLLDPIAVEAAVTPRTSAILVPHLYGQPCDMTRIGAIASRAGVVVIEDGSQAHGARHRGGLIGSFGDAAGFSTNGVKPIATTEGGYMITRLADVYWKAIISGQHAGRGELIGRASEPGFPDELRPYIDSLVYSYRPNLVTALLTLDRLPKLAAENLARRHNAELLAGQLEDLRGIRFPRYEDGDECVFHMVTMNFDEAELGVSRDTYLRALVAEGVPAVAYVEKGLHRSPRLSPDSDGPRVMWTETLRRAGVDPTAVDLPGCDAKVSRSIELPWNYTTVNEQLVASIAAAFWKLEEHVDELRACEREASTAV